MPRAQGVAFVHIPPPGTQASTWTADPRTDLPRPHRIGWGRHAGTCAGCGTPWADRGRCMWPQRASMSLGAVERLHTRPRPPTLVPLPPSLPPPRLPPPSPCSAAGRVGVRRRRRRQGRAGRLLRARHGAGGGAARAGGARHVQRPRPRQRLCGAGRGGRAAGVRVSAPGEGKGGGRPPAGCGAGGGGRGQEGRDEGWARTARPAGAGAAAAWRPARRRRGGGLWDKQSLLQCPCVCVTCPRCMPPLSTDAITTHTNASHVHAQLPTPHDPLGPRDPLSHCLPPTPAAAGASPALQATARPRAGCAARA